MGILRDSISSALGSNQVNNGLNGPKLPFQSSKYNNNRTSSSRRNDYDSDCENSDSRSRRSNYDYGYENSYDDYSDRSKTSYYSSQRDSDEVWDSNDSYSMQPPPAYDQQQMYPRPSGRPPSSRHSNGSRSPYSQSSRNPRMRPLALPQIAPGDGQPFLRGYSDELRRYNISEQDFMQIVDALNVAMIPNPENQIFQKGAGIAGWFVPGAASIGLLAGQIGVGIGAAYGHKSAVGRVLSNANLKVFIPNGLELCVGKSKDVDEVVGYNTSFAPRRSPGDSNPEARLASYGNLIAPLSVVLPPLQHSGRNDPIAMLGRGLDQRTRQKKMKDAQKDMIEGKIEKMNSLEGGLKWLIVRRASPGLIEQWRNMPQEYHTVQNDDLAV